LLAKLGKHTTGKGCLYIKKLADVDLKVLEALVKKAVAATRARHAKQG
jgi:predicted GIY-YIG superfamily endonuclease